jgi:hypothetical protein
MNSIVSKRFIRFYSTPIFNHFKENVNLKYEKEKKQSKEFKVEKRHKSFESYKHMYTGLPIKSFNK